MSVSALEHTGYVVISSLYRRRPGTLYIHRPPHRDNDDDGGGGFSDLIFHGRLPLTDSRLYLTSPPPRGRESTLSSDNFTLI